jgi:TonB-dependent starch-binding outer membrane protein SusC
MNSTRALWNPLAFVVALGVLLSAPGVLEAQQGTLTGQVTDARTGAPISAAQVFVVGTQVGTLTDANGNYRIANLTAGPRQISAMYLGYRTETLDVNVLAGQVVTLDFRLAVSAVALDEIIVTGTAGRQDRRAQAASISSYNAAAITEIAPITSVATLLQARATGVSISTASGNSGSGQRIRLRGTASVVLSNEPIVIVDGIRTDSRISQIYGVGGQAASRLNDINPEDIESIEIVKGPAAATLYGADASAGVIQIRTKRGRPGVAFTQTVSYEQGIIQQNWTPPANFAICSATHVADSRRELCFGKEVGTIISDSPLERYDAFREGSSRNMAWSGRGGGDNYGYFLSFSADEEAGTLPNNYYDRYTGRVNFDFTPREDLQFEVSMGLGRIDTELPNNDNNIYGFLGGALLGSPLTVGGFANDGWFSGNRQVEAIRNLRNENMTVRVSPVFTIRYTPRPWFRHRIHAGLDMSRSEARYFYPKNDIGWYGTVDLNSGQIGQARQNRDEITLDYMGSVQRGFLNDFVADLAFGGQFIAVRSDLTSATGIGLTTNTANAINAASRTTGGQSYSEAREGGFFAQLDLAWRDRMYLQLGGRLDKNSAFGEEVGTFFNPKVGVSYVISEEDFYPEGIRSFMPTLRLRSVWGSTGRSPGSTAALTTYSAAAFAVTSTTVGSGVVPTNPGNAALSPERGVEVEVGFDAGLFGERVGLEVTYYDKTSRDLILSRPIAPSLGFGSNPLVNIGELKNTGWEMAVNARLLELPAFAWDARLNVTTNKNEVTDLGDVVPFGSTYRVLPGFPAYGVWTHKIRSFDVANNRAIVSDTTEFVGNSDPSFEGNFGSTFTLFRNFRIYAQFDWMRDFIIYNNTDQFRERQFGTGERWVLRNDILTDEERLTRFGPFRTEDGRTLLVSAVTEAYHEPGDFLRFRELSLSYTIPQNMAQMFKASSATVTVSGRNLGLWTDYLGADPEVLWGISGAATSGAVGSIREDFLTLPQPRRWLARVNVTF